MSFSLFLMLVSSALWSTTWFVEAQGKMVGQIYWNSSNPIFAQNNSNHDITVRIMDSINFICPSSKEAISEVSVIYMVDRKSSDLCKLPRGAGVAGICDPSRPLITVVFRIFTPNPNALEFPEGGDYYFITTSTGTKEGLLNRDGGLCQTKNMRLRVRVKPKKSSHIHISTKKPESATVEIPLDTNELYPRPMITSQGDQSQNNPAQWNFDRGSEFETDFDAGFENELSGDPSALSNSPDYSVGYYDEPAYSGSDGCLWFSGSGSLFFFQLLRVLLVSIAVFALNILLLR